MRILTIYFIYYYLVVKILTNIISLLLRNTCNILQIFVDPNIYLVFSSVCVCARVCIPQRYGPGLVIYWFGFVETLVSPKFNGYKKDIMVKADFPSPIMLPDAQIL